MSYHQPPIVPGFPPPPPGGWPAPEPAEVAPLAVRRGLHWYQWVVYTVVLIACLMVIYSLFRTWLFIGQAQEWMEQIGDEWRRNFGS